MRQGSPFLLYTVLVECGKMLADNDYKIKVLNTINFTKSMRYNPFQYIRSEKDILKLVNTIIMNTKGDVEKSTEDFWVKSERLLYCALIGFIYYEAPDNKKTSLLCSVSSTKAKPVKTMKDFKVSLISSLSDSVKLNPIILPSSNTKNSN
jgi:TraG/TraD family.